MQTAGRLPIHLAANLKKLKYLPSYKDQVLLRPQTAEQLFGWEGGGQGKAAKEKANG